MEFLKVFLFKFLNFYIYLFFNIEFMRIRKVIIGKELLLVKKIIIDVKGTEIKSANELDSKLGITTEKFAQETANLNFYTRKQYEKKNSEFKTGYGSKLL